MAYVAATFSSVDSVQELAQLIGEEFAKIEEEMWSAQGAATLIHDEVITPGVANLAPSILTFWTEQRPHRSFRAVVPNSTDGQIIAARSGQYLVNFTVTALVDPLRTYFLEVFLNGSPTLLRSTSDPSQQTTIVTMVGTGSARVPREDERNIMDLRVSADQDGSQFDVEESYFTSAWVGD